MKSYSVAGRLAIPKVQASTRMMPTYSRSPPSSPPPAQPAFLEQAYVHDGVEEEMKEAEAAGTRGLGGGRKEDEDGCATLLRPPIPNACATAACDNFA